MWPIHLITELSQSLYAVAKESGVNAMTIRNWLGSLSV